MSEKGKRILIVDDEGSVVRILRYVLEKGGYLVDSASNGEKALGMIREQQPDVLVTDVLMPYMSGTQLCQTLAKEFPQRSFLIIVMTSKTIRDELVCLEGLENMVFFEKPLSPRQLIKLVADYFSGQDVSSRGEIYG